MIEWANADVDCCVNVHHKPRGQVRGFKNLGASKIIVTGQYAVVHCDDKLGRDFRISCTAGLTASIFYPLITLYISCILRAPLVT